jgi:exopolyphosphatase/guanosine-5'-triphosphate,3'-diphosphate pyrophosphatase
MAKYIKRINMSPRTIGIDLGSNTLRAIECDCESGEFGGRFGAIVKTADGLTNSSMISEAAMERVIVGLGQMRKAISFNGAQVRAVTTEAMRQASNADEVLGQIFDKTGVRFEIIDGDEEAKLTLLAVRHRLEKLDKQSDSLVLVDIGGGSTELIFAFGDEVVSQSFPLGIVTLSQSHETLDDIAKALPEVMRDMERFTAEVYVGQGRPDVFVATAGTPTSIAAIELGMEYDTYDSGRINGTFLSRNMPMEALDLLLSLPFEQRECTVGVGRADLVTAGILIFDRLYSILGFDECTVIDDGLREGVALELCFKLKVKN